MLPDGNEVVRDAAGEFVFRNSNLPISRDADNLIPMQILRYMEAETASYFYETDTLIAEQVNISRFAVPGHEIEGSFDNVIPLMTGIAESVEFKLDGNDPEFQASQFKAILYHSGG